MDSRRQAERKERAEAALTAHDLRRQGGALYIAFYQPVDFK